MSYKSKFNKSIIWVIKHWTLKFKRVWYYFNKIWKIHPNLAKKSPNLNYQLCPVQSKVTQKLSTIPPIKTLRNTEFSYLECMDCRNMELAFTVWYILLSFYRHISQNLSGVPIMFWVEAGWNKTILHFFVVPCYRHCAATMCVWMHVCVSQFMDSQH